MPPIKDMTGKRFGSLLVIEKAGLNNHREMTWLCKCDCGKATVVPGYSLRKGHTSSCGCQKYVHQIGSKNCNFKGGHCRDRLYHVWMTMKQRCFNPNHKKYPYYGGRGITVCDEWLEYEAFRTWAYANGYDDKAKYGKSTIDRIDVNGNYEPGNCRFVDLFVQSRNRRNVIAKKGA